MKIQQLTKLDWPIYKQIRLEALQTSPQSFGTKYEDMVDMLDKYWQAQVSSTDNLLFVAIKDKSPIGLVRVTLNDPDAPDKYAYLGSLFVSRGHRGQGVASALMKYAENYLKQNSATQGIYLEVRSTLEHAIKLYQSLGYQIIDRIGGGEKEELKMIKDL